MSALLGRAACRVGKRIQRAKVRGEFSALFAQLTLSGGIGAGQVSAW